MSQKRRTVLTVEQLETRFAPATLVNSTTVTYRDLDGDDVSIKFSKPILTDVNKEVILQFESDGITGDNSVGQRLVRIYLDGVIEAAGTSITTTAKANRTNGGNGLANLGEINAPALDLGKVTIDGDLNRIIAGDSDYKLPGVKSLTVDSLGVNVTGTGTAGRDSVINGKLGSLKVNQDVLFASLQAQGGAFGQIGSVTIGGTLWGSSEAFTGFIKSEGDMGKVKIGVSISGIGFASGAIEAFGKMGNVSIGGFLVGGNGQYSGRVASVGPMGSVKIGGSVQGGVGANTGEIHSDDFLKSVTVNTNITLGKIHAATIGKVNVVGSVLNGSRIGAINSIGSVTIGNLGGSGPTVTISAGGSATPTTTKDVAIGKLTIKGNVTDAQILAGYNANGNPVNADAQIGSVSVGGDWIRSSIAAGALRGSIGFGDGGDSKITGGKDVPGLFSKIASLTIAGQAVGDSAPFVHHYGIVAEYVAKLKIGGASLALRPGNSNDVFDIPGTVNFSLDEI